MATYSRRFTRKRSVISAEFMWLLFVLGAGLTTAWFAGHQLIVNLSGIQTAADVLGVGETVGIPHQVGYSQTRAPEADAQPTAPYCQAGQVAAFANGMAALKQQVGDAMGTPVECEHAASVVGDTVQHTSTGLAAYNSITNTESFTDGWHHWALTANGLVAWEGTEANPPATVQAAAPDNTAEAPPDQTQ